MENKSKFYLDSNFRSNEQLLREFCVSFKEVGTSEQLSVRVELDGIQLGDVIDDNAKVEDYYRYHDVFHYTFATMLGWSPCARAMMKRKRKSNELVDRIEDGARATITEEAISLIIFNEAKRKNFFAGHRCVSKTTLRIIKEMTEPFEVKQRTSEDWEIAILKSYEIFRKLIGNRGGTVYFNMYNKTAEYFA